MPVVRLSAAVVARRPVFALCALLLAFGVAACGSQHSHGAAGVNVADANNNGGYVFAGPLTYQLQISRVLNQYSTEDSQYVRGLPYGVSANLPASEMWYGVFLWAKNQTDHPHATSDSFRIVDTESNYYYPLSVDTALNEYAWTSQTLAPGAIEPAPNTTASFGPTQGGLLLFKLPITVYDNRPLTLQILGPDGAVWGSISLDV
jgi:hypothetical protein